MIVSQLIGGLGNQLFQYAVARHLAEINQTDLYLDLSEFLTYDLHKYSLHHFNITATIAPADEAVLPVAPVKEKKYYHFDPTFKAIGDNVRLKGYWQTEKYFLEIADIIRREFEVKHALEGKNREVADAIAVSNAVGVHVRRGDYTKNSYNDQILDSLDVSYYTRAVELLAQRESDLCYFVFSDDPVWVKDNLRLPGPVVHVDHNADANYEDLRLMSLCKHNIIANSSFSWWGAWLNRNEHKRVFAPRQWLNSNARTIVARDIIPESWTKI